VRKDVAITSRRSKGKGSRLVKSIDRVQAGRAQLRGARTPPRVAREYGRYIGDARVTSSRREGGTAHALETASYCGGCAFGSCRAL
jgi:hypothetical protein